MSRPKILKTIESIIINGVFSENPLGFNYGYNVSHNHSKEQNWNIYVIELLV